MKKLILLAVLVVMASLSACAGFGRPGDVTTLPNATPYLLEGCPAAELLAKGATPEDAILVIGDNYETLNICRTVVAGWIKFYGDIKKNEKK